MALNADREALPRLVDAAQIPSYYCDGVAKVEILGPNGSNLRITFFEYRLHDGETVRMPVIELIRPVDSVISTADLQKMLRQAKAVILEGSMH